MILKYTYKPHQILPPGQLNPNFDIILTAIRRPEGDGVWANLVLKEEDFANYQLPVPTKAQIPASNAQFWLNTIQITLSSRIASKFDPSSLGPNDLLMSSLNGNHTIMREHASDLVRTQIETFRELRLLTYDPVHDRKNLPSPFFDIIVPVSKREFFRLNQMFKNEYTHIFTISFKIA